jgi:hypothetical protein
MVASGHRRAACAALSVLVVLATASATSARRAAAPALTLDDASATAVWKEGYLRPGAAIRFSGSVAGPSHITAILRPKSGPKRVTAKVEFDVAGAGSFSERIDLPPRPLPGTYSLRLVGTSGGAKLPAAQATVSIPTPPEGVVARSEVSLAKGGKQVPRQGQVPVVKGTPTTIWVRYRFLYPPKGHDVKVTWNLHWRHRLGVIDKKYGKTIDTFVKSGAPLPAGVWNVVLTVDGRVAKQTSVHIVR